MPSFKKLLGVSVQLGDDSNVMKASFLVLSELPHVLWDPMNISIPRNKATKPAMQDGAQASLQITVQGSGEPLQYTRHIHTYIHTYRDTYANKSIPTCIHA